jgi:hypothetical protein
MKIIKTPTLREQPIYDENPFIVEGDVTVNKVKKTKVIRSKDGKSQMQSIVDADGVITGHSVFMAHSEVDEERFAKIYIAQMGIVFDLPKQSQKVLQYVLSVLKPNDDRVYFDINDCKIISGYNSEMSIYMGLNGLIDAKIMARTKRNYQYFINPAIVFNGNRITMINNFTKRQKDVDKNQTSLSDNTNFLNE